jgi:hypothetical protein
MLRAESREALRKNRGRLVVVFIGWLVLTVLLVATTKALGVGPLAYAPAAAHPRTMHRMGATTGRTTLGDYRTPGGRWGTSRCTHEHLHSAPASADSLKGHGGWLASFGAPSA